ncbi:S-methyl-5-thioribose-1-phosphate isomerase [Candidatus Woesearchaeota archaeon]|nr:S-methyl-5-thioribose-1-phosphate isomerase [Candidatus Woesearchaeota archaeon]
MGEERPYVPIWKTNDNQVWIIDQTKLPAERVDKRLTTFEDGYNAIKKMEVCGAGLIGVTAAYTMWLAAKQLGEMDPEMFRERMQELGKTLKGARPTAVNLAWAVDQQLAMVERGISGSVVDLEPLMVRAENIHFDDGLACHDLGVYGCDELIQKPLDDGEIEEPVGIMTHCNAGELAFAKYGSATGPIYEAHRRGIDVRVWVSETRPKNQGSSMTAWELNKYGVPHTIFVDNAASHIMQNKKVDLVIVGADRVVRNGDVANKIGTRMKAVVADIEGIPFYVALPTSTFDLETASGKDIPIEERGEDEIHYMWGMCDDGVVRRVRLTPEGSQAANYAFDVTEANLVTRLITEKGICEANEEGILKMLGKK